MLEPRYDASSVEAKWYQAWEDNGLFKPSDDPSKPKFVVTIPPPNITGSLHMGHSLCYPTQDLLGRFERLRGKNVLILPGQDHAGIATQSVVSKNLKKEGINPTELGREKFIEKVWEWRKESGDTILSQFRQLGCAFDWSRSRFTLDPNYVEAVLKVFIDWYNKGLIYRGKRVVNWDPALLTTVSDIETERKNIKGKLYHIRYPFSDGSGEVIIATTRPETMLADVAVAVHPSDKRYDGKVGKTVILPLMNREIPLIADQYPDPEFGTGAVKITPAHDPNDFEVGRRHGLDMPVILDPKARVVEGLGRYSGMERYEARKAVVADLEEQGYLVKIEDHEIPIIVSERSGEVIEPLLSEQWFVSQTELAGPAIEVVKSGKIQFVPERYNKVYLDWMENIRDWCISRQLWWGHRVPVYYTESGQAFAALSWDDAQAQAGSEKIIRQDDDVLDTWFSSGLWPFATLGWPAETSDLKEYYPTSLLVTDRNIIYLWVARMIMMGMSFKEEIPFSTVYIHATVMTEDGKRMSKSLGTGVDPRDVISKIGADPLRYTLLSQAGFAQEIRYSERRTEDARNFCNKIWNATRFVLMNSSAFPSSEGKVAPEGPDGEGVSSSRGSTPSGSSLATSPCKHGEEGPELEPVDKWLLSRLARTSEEVYKAYDSYDIQGAAQALYRFFWSELCDWYIEIAKSRITQPAVQHVLLEALRAFMLMMHPIMPHITEEIWHHLPGTEGFVMNATWPTFPASYMDSETENQVTRWFEIVRAARALRAELGIGPGSRVPQIYVEGDLAGGESVLGSQAWFESVSLGRPEGKFISSTVEGVDLHLATEGLIDEAKELERLGAQKAKLADELAKADQKLSNPNFVQNAKPEVVEQAQAHAASLREQLAKVGERITLFGG